MDNGTTSPLVETLQITARHAQRERSQSLPLRLKAHQVSRIQLDISVSFGLSPDPVETDVVLDSGWVEIWPAQVDSVLTATAETAGWRKGRGCRTGKCVAMHSRAQTRKHWIVKRADSRNSADRANENDALECN